MKPRTVTPLHASPEVTRLLLASDRCPPTPYDPTHPGSLGAVPCKHYCQAGLAIWALGIANGSAAMSTWRALSTRPASTEHRPFGATSEHWVPDQRPAGRSHASIAPAPSSPRAARPEEALPVLSSGFHAPTVVVLGGQPATPSPGAAALLAAVQRGLAMCTGLHSLPSGGCRCPCHPWRS